MLDLPLITTIALVVLVLGVGALLFHFTSYSLRRSYREEYEPAAPPPIKTQSRAAEMRQDHRTTTIENAGWLDEVERWRREEEALQPLLERLEKAVGELDGVLGRHAETIRRHQEQIDAHERLLGHRTESAHATAEAPVDGDYGRWCNDHQMLAAEHAGERDTHRRLAATHRLMMSEIDGLVDVVEKTAGVEMGKAA